MYIVSQMVFEDNLECDTFYFERCDLSEMMAAYYHDLKDDDVAVNEIIDGRISFAFEYLTEIPVVILRQIFDIRSLDLSHNDFINVNFIRRFELLTTLILDRNDGLDFRSIPAIETLEILWINNCGINDLSQLIYHLSNKFPKLRHLSLMGNPCAISIHKGNSVIDNHCYRMFVTNLLPNLEHLDDRKITAAHRYHAQNHHFGPLSTKCTLNRVYLQSLHNLNKSLNNTIQEQTLEDQMLEDYQPVEEPSLLDLPSLNSSMSSPRSGNRLTTTSSESSFSIVSITPPGSVHSVHSISSNTTTTSAIWSASNLTSKDSTSPATEDFSEHSDNF